MPANHPITFTLGQFMVLLMLKVPVRKAVGPLILHCWSFLTVIIKLSHYSCGPWTNQSGKLWQHSCRPWTNQSWSSLILGIRPIYKLNRPSFNQSPWLASQEVPGPTCQKYRSSLIQGPRLTRQTQLSLEPLINQSVKTVPALIRALSPPGWEIVVNLQRALALQSVKSEFNIKMYYIVPT